MSNFVATPFSPNELHLLESTLDPDVVAWAMDNPNIRESGKDSRLIRDLAAVHALSKVVLAKGRLQDFEFATALGHDVNTQYPELHYKSPAEMGGRAAGQLAVAKLMTTWYSLDNHDFTRLLVPQDALEFTNMSTEFLQEAVCTAPKVWGIAPFSARDVFLETMFEAQNAIRDTGPNALSIYMDFPEYPIVLSKGDS